MGLYQPIYSMNGASIEFAVLERLDLLAARENPPGTPAVDDVMEVPFLVDRGDGVGARFRPVTLTTIRAKVSTWPKSEEQEMDQAGNDPDSQLLLTLYEEDLLEAGLLVAGSLILKPGDRLLRLLNSDGIEAPDGTVRIDFARNGRKGLRCLEVRPGLTGERKVAMIFESQRESSLGLSGGAR